MSTSGSPSVNHLEQVLNKSSIDELSQLLFKQLFTQNKNIIDNNQILINEIRDLNGVIQRQNDEFIGFRQTIKKLDESIQQINAKFESLSKSLQPKITTEIIAEKQTSQLNTQVNAVQTPVKIEEAIKKESIKESQKENTAPLTNGKDFSGFIANKNLASFAELAKSAATNNTQGFTFALGGGKPPVFGNNTNQQLSSTPLAASKLQPAMLFQNQLQQKPAAAVSATNDADGEDGDDGNVNPEEYEPSVDFKPLVTLKEVEVKTGEEDEEVIFKERCKLYRFTTGLSGAKEWKEKGVGEMKILKHKENGSYRILMRRDQVLKLCANHRILPEIKLEIANEKQVRWSTNDYSDNEAKYEILLAKFRHENDAKKFKAEFEKAQAQYTSASPVKQPPSTSTTQNIPNGKPSLVESLKIEKGTWSCTECLAQNKPESTKCACCQKEKTDTKGTALINGTNKQDTAITKPTEVKTATTPIAPALTQLNKPFSVSTFLEKPVEQPTSTTNTNPSTVSFATKNLPSFGDLAKNSPNGGFLFGTNTENKPSLFGTSTTTPQLFGQNKASPMLFQNQFTPKTVDSTTNADADGEDGDDGNVNPEEYEPSVDFKPLVTLKEVEVKTGEEDEEVIFKERCKLYRFTTGLSGAKEWKEKGVGEMKILKHKENGSYRILMRRDQVLKLCANHRILPEIKLEIANEKQVRWSTNDYSDNEAKYEILLAKFRHENDAKKFKAEFEKAQAQYTSASPVKQPPSTSSSSASITQSSASFKSDKSEVKVPSAATSNLQSLSDLIKVDKGTWSCTQCLVANKPEIDKCACCMYPKNGTNITNTNSGNLHTPEIKPAPINPAFKFGLSEPTPLATGSSKLNFTPSFNLNSLVNPPPITNAVQPTTPVFGNGFSFAPKPTTGFPTPTVQNTAPSTQLPGLPRTPVPVLQPAATLPTVPVQTQTPSTLPQPTPSPFNFTSLGNKNLPSFGDLAKNSPNGGFLFGTNTENKPSLFGTSTTTPQLFGQNKASPMLFQNQFTPKTVDSTTNADADGEDGDDGNVNPEEYEPSVDFKPLVTLKEVEVKTGEEDEEVMFKERCKLYRFTTGLSGAKEWKEKGVGEMKILKHKENGSYRILMRRDQVLKLCANHRILPEIKLEIANEKQVRWSTNDYSDNEAKYEILLAKFRHENDAKKFKAEFEKAQTQYTSASPVKQPPSTTTTQNIPNGKPSLVESLKIEKGTWSCTECLAQNKPDTNKCACCQFVKLSLNNSNKKSDEDISVVTEVKATKEQVDKAKQFGLPENFYLYENKENCPGCRGCSRED